MGGGQRGQALHPLQDLPSSAETITIQGVRYRIIERELVGSERSVEHVSAWIVPCQS